MMPAIAPATGTIQLGIRQGGSQYLCTSEGTTWKKYMHR